MSIGIQLGTLLKHLWQQLHPQVFLSMMLQAWRSFFEQFLQFFYAEPPSSQLGSFSAQWFPPDIMFGF